MLMILSASNPGKGDESEAKEMESTKRHLFFSLPCKTKYDEKRAGDGVEVTD